MTNSSAQSKSGKLNKVGILLVHGIGETKKFENIEAVVRNIATALQAEKYSVRVIANASNDGAFRASQQTWMAQGALTLEVRDLDKPKGEVTQLIFSEVWWADLGKSDTLKSQLSFWKWGLSLWSRKQFLGKKDEEVQKKDEELGKGTSGTVNQTVLSSTVVNKNENKSATSEFRLFARLTFFVVSWVVLLTLPLLSFLSVITRRVLGFNNIRPDILVQYLGDVKRYQQDKREGAGALLDLGQPPRITVRRRMIEGLVRISLADYHRWYVLSHSLGTVVAFNGLMETNEALPNYLNQDLWEELQKLDTSQENKLTKRNEKLDGKQINSMFPRRPAWLEDDDIINRGYLFKNLRGFMTYGSPLSKFAVVWPAIVPLNKDESAFLKEFEWINVYDPTDPVADETKYFNAVRIKNGNEEIIENREIQSREIAYKTESIHLLSHIKYLDFNPKRAKQGNPLVKQVANWLLTGEHFKSPNDEPKLSNNNQKVNSYWGWPRDEDKGIILFYVSIRYLIWLVTGVFISWILSLIVPSLLDNLISSEIIQVFISKTELENIFEIIKPYISSPFLYFVGSAVVVLIFGIVVRFLEDNAEQQKQK